MSHYSGGGFFNSAYHDSETLEVDRSPSRKSYHSNPYAREEDAWQRGRADWPQPEGQQSNYDDAQGRVPWGGWQEGSWRGRDSIPLGLLSPRTESPRWQHDHHSSFQIDTVTHYDPSPSVHLPSATSGNISMRWRGTMRRMSLFPGANTALGITEDAIRHELESEEQDLVKELVAMSATDRIKAIRDLPMSFDNKKHIRSQVLAFKSLERFRKVTYFADCSENVSLSFRRCGVNMASARQALELWQSTMKEIGGKFGTGVLSYFLFLKWLLMFNVFSFLVNFGFITIPQLIYNPTPDIPAGVNFKGLEILTGAGYFQHTVMYYGGYSNETIEAQTEYNLQLAYFFTIAAYMVLCGAALIYSMASSFRRNYVLADPASGGAWQLLCSWDFSVTNERAVRQRKNNLRIQLKESLSERTQVALLSVSEKLKHFGVFLGSWLLSTSVAVGCGAAVYYLCQYEKERINVSGSLLDEAATLLLPFVVSLINLVVPLFYSLFNKIEHYSNSRMQIYAIIVRNVILKMSILGILCSYWMDIVASHFSCWESIVGQALYRLVIVDFLFLMLGSFFGEFLSNVIGTRCIRSLGVPEFDVARNVLDLIYAQTLAWIGIYFSPLLPVIQIIKFFILFYLKKVSLTQNCQPPRRSGRAAQMQTIFIGLLFFPSFLGALSMVAYTVWSLKPSGECGPFRGLNRPFSAVSVWIDEEGDVTMWIYKNVIRSKIFYFLVTLNILVIIYIFWQVTQGRKFLIVLLKQQIVNEGKDKAFLLEKLQNLQKSKQNKTTKQKNRKQTRRKDDSSSGGQSSSNGMLQALLARQQLEEEEAAAPAAGVPYGVSIPSEASVSTTSSAMMQVMLARQRVEEQEGDGFRRMTFPAAENAEPQSSSALTQAMQARQRAEGQEEMDDYTRRPAPPYNLASSPSSAMMQVLQAQQRAERQEEDDYSRAPVDPVSSGSSAVIQVMQARQRAEEDDGYYQGSLPTGNTAPAGSSALIQAMLARQQMDDDYDERY